MIKCYSLQGCQFDIFFSEKIRSILKMKCEDAWAQLNRLDDIRQKLEIDLQDKTEALRIDIDQIELTERSSGLSHKPDPTKVRCRIYVNLSM